MSAKETLIRSSAMEAAGPSGAEAPVPSSPSMYGLKPVPFEAFPDRRVRKPSNRTHKTNAARALDALGIAYELRGYEVDVEDLTAVSVAKKIGMPLEQVFKTLLVRSADGEYLFGVVPGDAELDLKKLAAVAGTLRLEMAALKDVEPLTGYVRGGVTVLAAKKSFPAFVDETVELFDVVSVSAGQRGLQLLVAPAEYLRATGAAVADLTKAMVQV